jgi:ABC-2 type transport system permease protein
MRYLKMLLVFCKLGILSETEYRANLILHLFESIMSFLTGVSVLWVVFSQTNTVGGWHWNELMVLLGLWFVTNGVVNLMIAPSIRAFMHDVWLGGLDYLLTKPENHQFMASTRKILIFNVVDVLVGLVVIIVALVRLSPTIGGEQALKFAITLFSGATILYSFWIILGTLSLWTVKLENMMLVFYSMFAAGRWPAGLYPAWLRYSLTFLVPIALAITVPAEAIVGRLSWTRVGISVVWAITLFFGAKWFFNYAVRYKYMGASA